MDNHVRFISKAFPPLRDGTGGKEMACWLCLELVKHNIVTSPPRYEDWGWIVEYTTEEGDVFWLCCGTSEDRENEWHCYIQPLARSFMSRGKVSIEKAVSVFILLSPL